MGKAGAPTLPIVNGSINYRYAANPYALPVLSTYKNPDPSSGATPAPDYTQAGATQNGLLHKLYTFFGQALGCNVDGSPTGFPSVFVLTDLEAVHRHMPISPAIFDYFNDCTVTAAADAGITDANDQATVRALLNSFTRGSYNRDGTPSNVDGSVAYVRTKAICNIAGRCPCAGDDTFHEFDLQCLPKITAPVARPTTGNTSLSVCEYYTSVFGGSPYDGAGQYKLVQTIVQAAVSGSTGSVANVGVFQSSVTKVFFDGSVNFRAFDGNVNKVAGGSAFLTKSPNFVANEGGSSDALIDHLVKYLGNFALGCQGLNFPAYDGVTSMKAVHMNMPITQAVFSAFNGQVAAAATNLGVQTPDLQLIGQALAAFGRGTQDTGILTATSICNQDGCSCYPIGVYSGNECTVGAAANLRAFSMAAMIAVAVAMLASA